MKTITYFFIAIFTISGLSTVAQSYQPTERKVDFNKVTALAWVVAVDDEPLDELKDGWSDYVRQELDVKSKKDGRDALVAREVAIPSVAQNVGDLRAKFYTEGNRSQLAVAFTTGYSTDLNSDYPEEAQNLRRLLKNFVKYYKTDKINQEVAQYEKRERDLELLYEKNERTQRSLEKHLTRIDKQLNSKKTDDHEKFDLTNQKIADESQMAALEEIMANQKEELVDINQSIQKLRGDISYLESMFVEPLAKTRTPIQEIE